MVMGRSMMGNKGTKIRGNKAVDSLHGQLWEETVSLRTAGSHSSDLSGDGLASNSSKYLLLVR